MKPITQFRPRLTAGAALFFATGLLAAAVTPSRAGTWPPNQGFASEAASSGFHRHFWRGSQLSKAPGSGAEMLAVADESAAMQAYCMDRFKSYDPASGTYLGYDGYEHACP